MVVNAEVLKALRQGGAFSEIRFFAEAAHRRMVLEAAPELRGDALGGGAMAVRPQVRARAVDWSLVGLLRREARGADTVLILLSTYRVTMFSSLLARLPGGGPGRGVIHLVHAELAGLWKPRRRNPAARLVGLASAFRLAQAAGDRVVVLETGIREEFLRKCPGFGERALLWPHPVPPVGTAPAREPGGAVAIGFLGWVAATKGFGRFLKAAAEVKAERGDGVSFRAIGHGDVDEEDTGKLHVLDIRPHGQPWQRDAFLAAARALDFICLFYDPAHYRYVASGVLLDAVALGTPVIAPRLRLVEAIAEAHGEIGLFYGSDAELAAAVREAADIAGTARYRRMVANLRRAAESRSTRALADHIARDLA